MCKHGEGLCGRDVVFNEALLWTWRHKLKGGLMTGDEDDDYYYYYYYYYYY